MRSGKILISLLAGMAAGATLGILLAPRKGSDTRKKISDKSDQYIEEMGDKFNSFIEGVSKQYENMKQKTMRSVEEAKAKVDKFEADAMARVRNQVNS